MVKCGRNLGGSLSVQGETNLSWSGQNQFSHHFCVAGGHTKFLPTSPTQVGGDCDSTALETIIWLFVTKAHTP